jgi:sterol desaturase/sphingolipid hydroxylase (fatty acid hydroxylase superfamily)
MGFLGLENGSFFRAPPSWVDISKPAGATSINKSGYGPNDKWWVKYYTLSFFFFSPQAIWSFITLVVYLIFPYNIPAAKEWAVGWVSQRAFVNAFVYVLYTGFWHVTLYWLNYAQRKFTPDVIPTKGRMVHNIFFGLLGTLMQTAWECCFLHLWATGRLAYIPNDQIFASWKNALIVFLGVFAVPAFRDFHFYFAHRFIHVRALYKYIHSLHHRNASVEPFSGLCMHPIEHMYYVTCMGIHLLYPSSPFHVMANGLHLTLSPGASHSGWEDHWHSDQFHYLHHAKFECNYGTGSVPYDYWFGTYKDVYEPPKKNGPGEKKLPKNYFPIGSLMPSQLSDVVPASHSLLYWVATVIILGLAAVSLWNESYFYNHKLLAHAVSAIVSVGPLVVAGILWRLSGDSLQFFSPFVKESHLIFGVHTVASIVMVLIPVYTLVLSTLSNTSVPCTLWGKC